jgi:histidine phosphotransferase ChpT
MELSPQEQSETPTPRLPGPAELAAAISAKLCHDMISPTSAINSGIDMLKDDDSELKDEALSMIDESATKLGVLLEFYRVAFGASASAEAFDVKILEDLTRRIFEYMRADLDWEIPFETLPKPAAKALINIAQIAGSALPRGGQAVLRAHASESGGIVLTARSEGRIILKNEVTEGLSGRPLGEGMVGYWVQGYYLTSFVKDAGGVLAFEKGDESFSIAVRLPTKT